MIDVINVTENDDGSATVDFNMSKDDVQMLIQYAVVDILEKYTKAKDVDVPE